MYTAFPVPTALGSEFLAHARGYIPMPSDKLLAYPTPLKSKFP